MHNLRLIGGLFKGQSGFLLFGVKQETMHVCTRVCMTHLGKSIVKNTFTPLLPFPEEIVVWVWEETVRM